MSERTTAFKHLTTVEVSNYLTISKQGRWNADSWHSSYCSHFGFVSQKHESALNQELGEQTT